MKGGLDGLGKQLLGQAGEAVMGAAKEYIGQVINEMFIVKKEAATKRFLPSIKNMKIVSCRETDESIVCTHVTLTFRIIIHSRFCNCNEIHLIAT